MRSVGMSSSGTNEGDATGEMGWLVVLLLTKVFFVKLLQVVEEEAVLLFLLACWVKEGGPHVLGYWICKIPEHWAPCFNVPGAWGITKGPMGDTARWGLASSCATTGFGSCCCCCSCVGSCSCCCCCLAASSACSCCCLKAWYFSKSLAFHIFRSALARLVTMGTFLMEIDPPDEEEDAVESVMMAGRWKEMQCCWNGKLWLCCCRLLLMRRRFCWVARVPHKTASSSLDGACLFLQVATAGFGVSKALALPPVSQ